MVTKKTDWEPRKTNPDGVGTTKAFQALDTNSSEAGNGRKPDASIVVDNAFQALDSLPPEGEIAQEQHSDRPLVVEMDLNENAAATDQGVNSSNLAHDHVLVEDAVDDSDQEIPTPPFNDAIKTGTLKSNLVLTLASDVQEHEMSGGTRSIPVAPAGSAHHTASAAIAQETLPNPSASAGEQIVVNVETITEPKEVHTSNNIRLGMELWDQVMEYDARAASDPPEHYRWISAGSNSESEAKAKSKICPF